MECVLHISPCRESDKIIAFSEKSWRKVFEYVQEWVELENTGSEYALAVQLRNRYGDHERYTL